MREPSSTAYASLDRDLADIESELRRVTTQAPIEPARRRIGPVWIPLLPLLSAALVLLALR